MLDVSNFAVRSNDDLTVFRLKFVFLNGVFVLLEYAQYWKPLLL
jgi:hypothetical protein